MMIYKKVSVLPRTTCVSLGVPAFTRSRAQTRGVAQKDLAEAVVQPSDDAGGMKELTGLTQQLIEQDPDMQAQLQRYQEAMARVDRAKAAAAELERRYLEAIQEAALIEKEDEATQRQQSEQIMADAEVQAAEKLLAAAQLQHELAQQEQSRLNAEMIQDGGRVESSKAAVLAVLGGAAGLLPIALLNTSNVEGLPALLSLGAAAVSCALFGVTYRYAVGSNPQNPHLRGGVVAAFGLVRGAAAADMLQSMSTDGPLSIEVLGNSALYAGQSVLMFGFAAAAIEAAFQQGFLRRIDEQSSR